MGVPQILLWVRRDMSPIDEKADMLPRQHLVVLKWVAHCFIVLRRQLVGSNVQ
jgi:hypothetical protein